MAHSTFFEVPRCPGVLVVGETTMALGANVLNWGLAWEREGAVSAVPRGGEGVLPERLCPAILSVILQGYDYYLLLTNKKTRPREVR